MLLVDDPLGAAALQKFWSGKDSVGSGRAKRLFPARLKQKEGDRFMRKALRISSLLVLAGGVVSAQEVHPLAFNLGAGFTTPVQRAGDRLDPGWNAGVGVGYNFNPYAALKLDFGYNSFGINSGTLSTLGFPDGDVQLWSLTLDPVVHMNPRGPVDLYLTGGGGLYHWTENFTQPGVATITVFDPYFGLFYPAAVPVTEVLSTYSVYKPGFDGGAGIAFGTKWNGQVYAEARFHRMIFGNNRYVDTIPVTFGFRW
jgi:Outer membrane protein beta-barrel domain